MEHCFIVMNRTEEASVLIRHTCWRKRRTQIWSIRDEITMTMLDNRIAVRRWNKVQWPRVTESRVQWNAQEGLGGGAIGPWACLKVFHHFLPWIIVIDFNLPFCILTFIRVSSLSNPSLYPVVQLMPRAFYSRGAQSTVVLSAILSRVPTKLTGLPIINHVVQTGQGTWLR